MNKTGLYFVGVLPSEPVLSEVRELKEVCRDRFQSARALRSPAHITLVPPFRAGTEDLSQITETLRKIAVEIPPFTNRTDHFGRFDKKVIFVRPGDNERLQVLYDKCNVALNTMGFTKLSKRAFHPHLTIAFRDLTPENFAIAWPYFKGLKYAKEYEIDALALFINGEHGWTVLNAFPLLGSK